MSDSPQLTLAQLDAARARIPSETWLALDHREQAFVAAMCADPTKNLGNAARAAGAPAKAARQTGYKLSKRPAVIAALAAIQNEVVAQVKTDAAYVVRRLRENDEVAFRDGDLHASNTALGHLGKATGAFEKRLRITFDDPAVALAQLQALPKAERVKAIRAMLDGA